MDKNKTIYNLQRFAILQAKLNPAMSNLIPDSYAYAWSANTFPFLNESDIHRDLKEYFSITEEQVILIAETADRFWRSEKNLNFYEYEELFRTNEEYKKYNIGRVELISVFRYLYLDHSFDSDFWEKLLEECRYPIEASGITRKFDQTDLYFI